jgi:hypothetical protein
MVTLETGITLLAAATAAAAGSLAFTSPMASTLPLQIPPTHQTKSKSTKSLQTQQLARRPRLDQHRLRHTPHRPLVVSTSISRPLPFEMFRPNDFQFHAAGNKDKRLTLSRKRRQPWQSFSVDSYIFDDDGGCYLSIKQLHLPHVNVHQRNGSIWLWRTSRGHLMNSAHVTYTTMYFAALWSICHDSAERQNSKNSTAQSWPIVSPSLSSLAVIFRNQSCGNGKY